MARLPFGAHRRMGQTYTFVGLTPDGRSPFLDVQVLESEKDLPVHARKLLHEHRSCSRIEVWDGAVRLMVVGHDLAETGEVAPG